MWLPYNGKSNQIRADPEKCLKYIITKLEGENKPIAYNRNIIGNYSVESFLGNFNAHASSIFENSLTSQVENYSQIDSSKCINFVDKHVVNSLFWKLFVDGSKSNDGAGAGCILIIPEGEKL